MTLFYLAVAWMAGILLGHLLWSGAVIRCATPGGPFAAAAATAAASLLILRKRPRGRLVATLALMTFLGAWRYQAHPFEPCSAPSDVAFYNSSPSLPAWVTLEGIVAGYPDVRDTRTAYRLRADHLTTNTGRQAVRGDVLLQAARFPAYRYGDRLRVAGTLQAPPVFDDFDYRSYLAGQGIYSVMPRSRAELEARDQGSPLTARLYALRERASELLNSVLPEPAAGLANGMLLGIESGIPADLRGAFQATGTTHVIVISGSNIAIFTGILLALLGRTLGRRRAALPVILCIAAYVLLVGADPSALRAGLMGALFVLAVVFGRQSTAWVSLMAAALLMTLFNPLALWDAGFQLSFAATLGLIFLAPALRAGWGRAAGRWPIAARLPAGLRPLGDALLMTLAAQAAVLPLVVYHFGRLSLVSPLANLLIVPAQPPILIGGMATLIGGLAWRPLGQLLAAVPWLFLTYTTAIVRLTAALPFASVATGRLALPLMLCYYAALVIAFAWRGRASYLRNRLAAAGLVGWWPSRRAAAWSLAVALPLTAGLCLAAGLPDGRLHILYLPGEGGEAATITLPSGRQAWVWDGQGDGEALAARARAQAAGPPAVVIAPSPAVDPASEPGLAQTVWPGARVIDPAELPRGGVIQLGDGVTLTRLDAGDSWALLLGYGQFRVLLPATLGPEAQQALLASSSDHRLTVLKAPGAGTGAWPTCAFLSAAAPQRILWPDDTTYPPEVEAALIAGGAERIPGGAALEITTDGTRLWLARRSMTPP